MKNIINYNMHYNDNYEPLRSLLDHSRFINENHGFYDIKNDTFRIVAYPTDEDIKELYILAGIIESRLNERSNA